MTTQLKTLTLDQLLGQIKVCKTRVEIIALKTLATTEISGADEETKEYVMKLIYFTQDLIINSKNVTIEEAMQNSQDKLNNSSMTFPDYQKQTEEAKRIADSFVRHHDIAWSIFTKNSR